MLLDRHLGFMNIARFAKSCWLDNKAEFVQSRHESISPSKRFIGKRISRLVLSGKSTRSNFEEKEEAGLYSREYRYSIEYSFVEGRLYSRS